MFIWNEDKNRWLAENRQIVFETIVVAIESGGLLAVLEHPRPERYENQKIMAVQVDNYVYAVPFVETGDGTFFLKTVFPSRKLTHHYLNKGEENAGK